MLLGSLTRSRSMAYLGRLATLFAVAVGGCAESGLLEPGTMITITAGPTDVRQGDVVIFVAEILEPDGSRSSGSVDWSVAPASAGLIKSDGRFVGYQPGTVRIVAEAPGASSSASDELTITIRPRNGPTGSFSVVGRGEVTERFTSDLWLNAGFAYTGTWGNRNGNSGNRLYAWDVSNPSAPVRTDELTLDAATVNDVKIRADGTLAVATHEGSSPNGITLLDLADPLHPVAITQFSETMESGVHDVWIEGDYVYAAVDGSSAASGLRIIDVSDPASPTIAASFYGGDPNVNFDQFLHDVYVRDGLAFLSHWDAGLIVLDVGNGIAGGAPTNPVEVSRIQTQGGDTHNAWYWPEGGYVFVGEEDVGAPGVMHVVDASNLSNLKEVAIYRVPGTTPHNFWLDEENEILYVGWYEQGVVAIDVSGELLGSLDLQGRRIASFQYDGLGGCFTVVGTCSWAPQLHDGLLWVSDPNSGLWALRPDFQ